MSTLIKLRRDTAANWASADPVLQLGEPGYDTTNNELRIGDGTTPWSGLTPIAGGGEAGLPLANGTSNFNIAAASGNATVGVAGAYTWTFDTTGNLTVPNAIIGTATIDIDNRATGNSADIRLYSADDIVLQARTRTLGSTSEGGDINIYAGDSAEDGDTSGGDVVIEAGDGGAGNVDYGGSGGFIRIESGRGGAAIGNSGGQAESGGALTLNAGDAGSNNGNIDLGADGGNVYIGAGDSTGNGVNGGTIYLTSGAADASALAGDVVIQAGGTWTFDGDGQINIPPDSSSFGTGHIQSANGYPTLLGYGSGEHGGPELDWTDGNDPTDIGNASVLRNTLYINDQGLYVGINENEVANVAAPSWRFNPNGTTIFPTLTVTRGDRTGTLTGQTLLFGDSTQEAIISTPNGDNDNNSSQRFVINPGAGADGTTGEGGDIYLYAGRGGNVGGSGGDIKIRGGLGPVNGDGGYINIEGGEAEADGFGGAIEIFGGQSGNAAGGSLYIEGGYGRTGGDANVSGGFGATGPGGDVSIIGGASGNGQAEYGNVIVATGSKNWRFDNTGNLVLPSGTPGINYANGDPFSGGAVNTGNVTFDDVNIIGTGNLNLQPDPGNNEYLNIYLTVADDIHIAGTGNVILGTDEQANVAVLSDGNVAIQAGNVGGTQTWAFDTAGNLTLPGNTIAINYLNGNLAFGTVTFNNEAVIGTGTGNTVSGLYLAPDPVSLTNDLYLRVRGNILDEPTHIHFDTGNNQYYNQFIGDDNKYIQLANTGNIVVNSNDNTGNTAQWTFDAVGNITLPTGGAIQTAPGSNGNIFIHPDGNGAVIIQGGASTLLTLASDLSDTQNRFEIDTYGANLGNLGGGVFTGTYLRTDGPTQLDDRLASFAGKGTEDGVDVQLPTAARITIDAAGNWSAGNAPSHISFWTTSVGANIATEAVRVAPSGNVVLYSGSVIAGNGYVKTTTYTAATLPTGVQTQGVRAFVSDADTRVFGNLVTGGAGNVMPVWSDGTNWYIG
jgi:hypothetical protein